MAAFTTIAHDTDWGAKALWNELVDALNERALAAGESWQIDAAAHDTIPLAETGSPALATACTVNVLQTRIEQLALLYIDHTQAVAGSYEGQSTIPAYTLTTFRAAAGLPSSGFRRATAWDPTSDDWTNNADAMYTAFGIAAQDDLFGPWTLVDLQRALLALKWTVRTAAGVAARGQRAYQNLFEIGCAASRTEHQTTWPGVGWSSPLTTLYYRVQVGRYDTGTYYRWNASRNKSTPDLASIWNGVAHEATLYGLLEAVSSSPGANPIVYADLDGLFAGAGEGQLAELEAFSSATVTTRTAAEIGNLSANPVDSMTCADPLEEWGCQIDTLSWLLKWSFTIDS